MSADRFSLSRPIRDVDRVAVRDFLARYALVLLLVGIFAFFSLYSATADTFLTTTNLRILVANQSVPAIVALAALLPLVCNEFDLSVGAISGLSAVFVASLLSGALGSGLGIPVALLVGVLIGMAVGVANALLVTRAAIGGVIATLGTSTIIAGIVAQKTGGLAVVSDIPASFTDFGSANLIGIPAVAWAFALVAVAVYLLLEHTAFGRQAYALGSNLEAARLVGLRVRAIVGVSFVLAGALAGLAGCIYVARAGGADPSVGPSFTLTALAAAFLSAAAIRPGRFNVGGTIVAVFFLAVLNNGLDLAGAAEYVSEYVNGAALIIGVALAVALARKGRA